MESDNIVRLFSGEMGSVYAFTEEGWLQLLELAREYGWKPKGTQLPPERENTHWAQDYLPFRYRIVSAEDAAALGEALEKAEKDLPDLHIMERDHERRPSLSFEAEEGLQEDGIKGKQWLDEFLAFCRAGEFRIG